MPSANPENDMMIEMGFNTMHETAVDIMPDLNVPSKGTDTSIVDSEALYPAGVGPPLHPAEGQGAAANQSPQQDNYVESNDKMEEDKRI
jgi:hypothetical protein